MARTKNVTTAIGSTPPMRSCIRLNFSGQYGEYNVVPSFNSCVHPSTIVANANVHTNVGTPNFTVKNERNKPIAIDAMIAITNPRNRLLDVSLARNLPNTAPITVHCAPIEKLISPAAMRIIFPNVKTPIILLVASRFITLFIIRNLG